MLPLLLGPPRRTRNGAAMVRISDDVRKTVVFFGIRCKNEIKYGGTGFLCHVRIEDMLIHFIVTARHVAEKLDIDFLIRANLRNGGADEIEIERLDWFYPDDITVDLAIAPYHLDERKYDCCSFQMEDAWLPSEQVLCGDPVAIVGLFRLRYGTKKNIPIVHSGHIASLADENERVPVDNGGRIINMAAHLVEAQTLGGISGSPVFVQQFIWLQKSQEGDKKHPPFAFSSSKIFGVYVGSWDARPGIILEEDRGLKNREIRVPVGVGIVTPGEALNDLIQKHPLLEAVRACISEDAASMDSALSDNHNPSHREDFTALLNAAAKKPQSKD